MVLPSWNIPALSPTPQRPLHDEQQQLQRREVVPAALILSITLALTLALTIERTKLFPLSQAKASCGIVHIFSPAPSLDNLTYQTISALLPRPFRGLLVTPGRDIPRGQVQDIAKAASRSIKRVDVIVLVVLYIHFHKLCVYSSSQAYLRMQGGSCSAVRLPQRIS